MGNNHGGKGTRKTCISCRRSGRGVQYHRSNRCPSLAENFGEDDGVYDSFPDDGSHESDTGQGEVEAKKEATEEAEKEATDLSAKASEAKKYYDEAEAAAPLADAQVSLPCPHAYLHFPPPCMHSPPLHHGCIRFYPMSAPAFLPNACIRLPSSCMHGCMLRVHTPSFPNACIPSFPTHAFSFLPHACIHADAQVNGAPSPAKRVIAANASKAAKLKAV